MLLLTIVCLRLRLDASEFVSESDSNGGGTSSSTLHVLFSLAFDVALTIDFPTVTSATNGVTSGSSSMETVLTLLCLCVKLTLVLSKLKFPTTTFVAKLTFSNCLASFPTTFLPLTFVVSLRPLLLFPLLSSSEIVAVTRSIVSSA